MNYPTNYNPIVEYWKRIQSGEEIVGDKIRRTYQKIMHDVEHPDEYFYSAKRANHILEFAEKYCRHSKGKYGGHHVKLELWEKAHLATIFGFIDIEGNRKYRESILIVGKKNGKSLLASIVGNYMLIADGEPGPEIYAVSTKKDQSKIIWGESKRMIRKSPSLRRQVRTLVAELCCDDNDGVFRPLGSDSDTLDGLNVHCCLMDEIHQWKNGRALYDIMADGVIAREQPLIYITSTAGTIREDIYDAKYDEAEQIINGYEDPNGYHDNRVIPFIYELDSRKEWQDPTCWKKANPGLGTIKSLEQLAEKVKKAQANPKLVKNLVCKEFNIRETSSQAWMTFDQLNNTATFDVKELKPRYGIGGVDLSITTDLTAATVLFMLPDQPTIYYMHMYWLPEDLLETRERDDKIPYSTWRDQGLLRTTPGNKVDYHYVVEWFKEIRDTYDIYIPWVGYDSYSAQYFVAEMKQNFGEDVVEPVIQGAKTLSGPLRSLGADLDAKIINYGNNPITKWCLTNVSVTEDRNANLLPCKTSNQRRRIDGFAAMLDAYVEWERHQEDYANII
jgi:phage terminase large subunit-like protein